jgi:hypothetical protein
VASIKVPPPPPEGAIKVVFVRDWHEGSQRVEVHLPAVPRAGETVILDDFMDGVVEEVVWEVGEPVQVRLG